MSDPGQERPRAMPSPFSGGPRAQPPIRTRPTRTPPPRAMPSDPGSIGNENAPLGSAAPRTPSTPIAPPSFGVSTPQGLVTPPPKAAEGGVDVAKPRAAKHEPVEETPPSPSPAVPDVEQAPLIPESAPPPAAAEQSTKASAPSPASEEHTATPLPPQHSPEATSAFPPVPEPRNRMEAAPAEDAVPYVSDGVVYSSYAGTSGRTSRTSYSINREEHSPSLSLSAGHASGRNDRRSRRRGRADACDPVAARDGGRAEAAAHVGCRPHRVGGLGGAECGGGGGGAV
ncbi:hypothetical protein T484DRAFT_2910703 [Baffinella frigidus]|nr:hypothetical protein T484DRAFT_2910703 [Cryptophyta sp. CCMP2293]